MKSSRGPLAKAVILLVISLGLLWFSEEFPPAILFETHTPWHRTPGQVCPGGRCQGSTGWVLWISYAKDLIQPFAFYFFICLGERWLETWRSRALVAFIMPTLLELSQFVYYRVSTGHYVGVFDPIDILMYALGVGLAVLIDQKVFERLLKFW